MFNNVRIVGDICQFGIISYPGQQSIWPRAPSVWTTVKGMWIAWSICPPDVTTALRQWHGLRAATAHYVFPSRMTRKGGLPLGARQIRNRMNRYLKLAGMTKRYSPYSLRH